MNIFNMFCVPKHFAEILKQFMGPITHVIVKISFSPTTPAEAKQTFIVGNITHIYFYRTKTGELLSNTRAQVLKVW